ncbi:hypothetical protein AWB98_02010 [Mycolicibacterium conceptionense]|uniref:Uncharacterized protein n=1 Tax=Mycolicibacterium conceptionense TaxID=451644 RepID=A0ABX3UZW9_9MYCO|nr:hypothetical protein AWB98_02010 [Mycolicibacterium conceptionense]
MRKRRDDPEILEGTVRAIAHYVVGCGARKTKQVQYFAAVPETCAVRCWQYEDARRLLWAQIDGGELPTGGCAKPWQPVRQGNRRDDLYIAYVRAQLLGH